MRKIMALIMVLMSGFLLGLACGPGRTRAVLWNGANFAGWVR